MQGGCTPSYVAYIGWDLTPDASKTWQSASLTLTHYRTTGGQSPFTLKIYPANNDTWTESGSDPGYNDGQELASASYNGTDTTLTFASDALGAYFLNKKGGPASIAVVMTSGCGVTGTLEFEDMEGTGGTAPQSAHEADLVFYTGQVVNGTPTAVEMQSFQVENDNSTSFSNWPLIAGLFALAAMAVVGIGYGVRRSKQS